MRDVIAGRLKLEKNRYRRERYYANRRGNQQQQSLAGDAHYRHAGASGQDDSDTCYNDTCIRRDLETGRVIDV